MKGGIGNMLAQMVDLMDLVGLERNPKEHDLGEIGSSMERFGFISRVIVNERTGHIIGGHGRVDTLRSLKLRGGRRPRNVEMGEGGEWLVPVDFIDIGEEQEEAAAIALNRIEERGGWDDVLLLDILKDLAEKGVEELEGTGFDGDDVDDMLRDANRMLAEEEREEEVVEVGEDGEEEKVREGYAEEALAEYQVKEGDVWEVGRHKVVCADFTWEEAVSWWTEGVDVCVTSPPYAEQRQGDYGGISEREYGNWFEPVQAKIGELLVPGGSFFLNLKAHVVDGQRSIYVMRLVTKMVWKWDWKFIDEFSWQRVNVPGSWPNRFKNGFEPIYHFSKDVRLKFRPKNAAGLAGEEQTGKWTMNGEYYNINDKYVKWDAALPSNHIGYCGGMARGYGHPAAFPAAMPRFFILSYSDVGNIVLDPFMGSGSTLIACEQTARIGIGVDREPKYCAVALKRLAEKHQLEPKKVKNILSEEHQLLKKRGIKEPKRGRGRKRVEVDRAVEMEEGEDE